MGLPQQVASIYQAIVGSSKVRIRRWPNATAGVKVTAGTTPNFSAWTQIVAAGTIDNPAWLTAIMLENPTNAGAAEVWLVDVATGASGSEVSLSSGTNTAQGIASATQAWVSSVGTQWVAPINLPFPIRLNGAPRLSAATAGLLVGGKDIYVALQTATGVGT